MTHFCGLAIKTIMYFDFRSFFRIAHLSFFRYTDAHSSLTLKRGFFLVGFFIFFPVVQLFNRICFLLDDIIYPQYRDIEIKTPVFVTGNPRSGTSFIHRVMATDQNQFFFFKTWEIIFPAIVQKKFLAFIGRIDFLLGSVFSTLIKRFEMRLFRDFNRMHRLGLFYPEEDDKVLAHIFSCFDLVYFFPFFEVFEWHCRFDQDAKPYDRKRIMTFYLNCVRRQAYFKGNKGHLIAKSPFFSSKIDSLFEYFPDAKIIYLVRNPLEVIPSMMSMAYEIWNSTINSQSKFSIEDKTYQMAKFFYDYPLAQLDQVHPSAYQIVKYSELISCPSRIIQKIYQNFGFDFSPEVKKTIDDQERQARAYKSHHLYSLRQFNISKEQIISELCGIFQRFDFVVPEEKNGGEGSF